MAVDHLEKTLFAAADKMRGAVPVSDYQYVALGLIFLMYISEAFEIRHAELTAEELGDPEDKDEYTAENIFWVPPEARWSYLAANARSPVIGQLIDTAMRLIEKENKKTLEGVLPTIFSNPTIPQEMLSNLIDQFTNDIEFQGDARDFDLMGRIYEYFLGEFVDFHREVTRAGARFPLRIDPCETLPLAGIVGGYRSDRHGVFDYYPALGTA